MEIDDGIELILKAFEKREEEKAFQLYIAKYQHMTKDNYIPFEEFYNPRNPVESDKSVDEILDEVRNTLNEFKGRWTR